MHKQYSEDLGIGVSFKRKDGLYGFATDEADLYYWLKMELIDNLDYVEGLKLLKDARLIT